MLAFVAEGLGIGLLSLIGIPGIIYYFTQYKHRSRSNKSFEFLLLVTLVFNMVLLVSGFSLISVTIFMAQAGHHSNSHMSLMPYLVFLATATSIGSDLGLLCLSLERYLLVLHPQKHHRLSSCLPVPWLGGVEVCPHLLAVLLVILLVSIGPSLFYLWEYTLLCHSYGPGAQEDIFSICQEGEMAVLLPSQDGTNFFYRLFTNLLLILASSIIPFLGLTWTTIILFLATSESSLAATVIARLSKVALWKSFSTKTSMSSTISEKDKGLITSTIAATCTLLLVKAVHGVPVVYELHSTVAMLDPYTLPPDWFMSLVSIAHFVAFLLPALNFYIFCGRDYLHIFIKAGARDCDSPNLSLGEEELGGQRVQLSQVAGLDNPNYAAPERGDNMRIQDEEMTKANDNSSFEDFLIPLDD